MNNPLLKEFDTLHQTVPFDKIKPEHFIPAIEYAMAEGRKEIDQIINSQYTPDFENTIAALDRSGERLGELSNLLFNQNLVETSPEIQSIVHDISPKLSEFSNDITLNAVLFNRVKTVYDNVDPSTLSAEQKTLLDKTCRQFIRSGANLSDKSKEIYRSITKELLQLTVKFGENVLAETNAYMLHIKDRSELSGLSDDLIQAAEEEAHQRNLEGWIFTMQQPSFVPFMKYADNRELRKEMAFAAHTRGLKDNNNDNREIIRRIVNHRMHKAQLLGFPDHASFILTERMAEKPEQVMIFLNELLEASMPYAKNEVEVVRKYAKSQGVEFELQSWDWSYYSEKLKKKPILSQDYYRLYHKGRNFVVKNSKNGYKRMILLIRGIR